MKTFRVKTEDRRVLDYRVGKNLDLDEIDKFFRDKYSIIKLWQEKRHAVGILEKSGKKYFLKVSGSEGIGVITKNEYNWNQAFNDTVLRSKSDFWVPKNYEAGYFKDNLFYFISDMFEGEKLSERPEAGTVNNSLLAENLERVIDLSELIQSLHFKIDNPHYFEGKTYIEQYLSQARGWYSDIPEEIQRRYEIDKLWQIVEGGVPNLNPSPKHGDFAPWHIMALSNGKLGLIDGEHAMSETIEGYDISFIIQRIFAVMQNPGLAEEIMKSLVKRNYDLEKIRIALTSRAIGGFLDEYLALYSTSHDFIWPQKFKDWALEQ